MGVEQKERRYLGNLRHMALAREEVAAVEQRWVKLGSEYVPSILEKALGDRNLHLHRTWERMFESANILDTTEVEGSTLTYDVYQERRRRAGKLPLIISNKVIASIGDDRESKLALHGGHGMYSADQRDFHMLLPTLSATAPDFHRLVVDKANTLLIRGRETSIGEQVRFLTGVREVWKMFLRQHQSPISVLLFGYLDLNNY